MKRVTNTNKDKNSKHNEVEKTDEVVRNILLILTLINLIVNFMIFPAMTYNGNNFFEATQLYNSIIDSPIFALFMWGGSILTYIVGLFYIVITIKSKKYVTLKIILTIVSVLYTPIAINLIMNYLSSFFFIGF